MKPLKKNYIVDENDRRIAVQLDIKTFEKIEETLENYALVQLMEENANEEKLSLEEAQEYYKKLRRAN